MKKIIIALLFACAFLFTSCVEYAYVVDDDIDVVIRHGTPYYYYGNHVQYYYYGGYYYYPHYYNNTWRYYRHRNPVYIQRGHYYRPSPNHRPYATRHGHFSRGR